MRIFRILGDVTESGYPYLLLTQLDVELKIAGNFKVSTSHFSLLRTHTSR